MKSDTADQYVLDELSRSIEQLRDLLPFRISVDDGDPRPAQAFALVPDGDVEAWVARQQGELKDRGDRHPAMVAERMLSAIRAFGQWLLEEAGRSPLRPVQPGLLPTLGYWISETNAQWIRLVGHARMPTLEAISEAARNRLRTLSDADRESGTADVLQVLVDLTEMLAVEPQGGDWTAVPVGQLEAVRDLLMGPARSGSIAQQDELATLISSVGDWLRILTSTTDGRDSYRYSVLQRLISQLGVSRSLRAAGDAEGAQRTVERLSGSKADQTQGDFFLNLADRLKWRARVMMAGAIALILVTAGTLAAALDSSDSGGSWTSVLARASVAVPVLLLAGYLARESSQSRRSEDGCRQLEAQLRSLDAFLEPLDPDQQRQLRTQFGSAVFAVSQVESGQAMSTPPTELVQALEALVRAIQQPRAPGT